MANWTNKCEEVVRKINQWDFEKQIPNKIVDKAIKVICGLNPKTLKQYRSVLIEFKFMRKLNIDTWELLPKEGWEV